MNKLTKEQFKFLMERNIIKVNDFVTIGCSKMDYKITDIKETEDSYHVSLHLVDAPNRRVKVEHKMIEAIDDMNIERIMQAYSVDDELSIVEIDEETDVANTIVGQTFCTYVSPQRKIDLEDGMKFIFHNDVNSKYRNKVLTVKGVGDSIKLVAPRGRPKKNA